MAAAAPSTSTALRVAIAGNPNAGKSSLFNSLTGLRQKVGNYPGVTVERKVGRCQLGERAAEIIDLPGSYSLSAHSPDEEIARDVLFGWMAAEEPPPDAVVVVVDATNLQRNLYLATQILELGYPSVVALNMADMAAERGVAIDVAALGALLGVPVVRTVASRGEGLDELRAAILTARPATARVDLGADLGREVHELAAALAQCSGVPATLAPGVALRLLASADGHSVLARQFGTDLQPMLARARDRLAAAGIPWQGCEAAARYPWLAHIAAQASERHRPDRLSTRSDAIDRWLTHRLLGPVLFFALMAVVFQVIFTWATPLMAAIDQGVHRVGELMQATLPDGVLRDLLTEGVITGVGAVLQFIPQILLLFCFLSLLEDSGYMARAAFVMDRIMSRVGLHGRSFVPLLSSFACAIPGVMATRTIASRRDRLVTMLISPLMTCSARLPVYALLIAAFVPQRRLLGGLTSTQGLALLGLYLAGIVAALMVAAVLKRTVLHGPTPPLLIELPAYRRPSLSHLARDLWERTWLFARFAGSVILSLSIVLWFLAAFPRADLSAAPELARQRLLASGGNLADEAQLRRATENAKGELQLEHSIMGRLGRTFEPLVRPLGFDWRIGVGLVGSFAAREVMVSTLGIVFAVGKDATEADASLLGSLREARRSDGSLLFTPATVASLLVFFVLACQCISTIAIVRRESGGWRWPAFLVAYTFGLAWTASFITYQGLCLAGWG